MAEVHPAGAARKIGLDIPRAVAISLVLLSHFVKELDFLGIHGVELFFALSGFLIGDILHRSLAATPRWSFREVRVFWLRRWWRTLPNYYLFFAVAVGFNLCFGGLPNFTGLFPFLAFSQNLLDVPTAFYGVSWSLCIEEWFYLLFPLSILLFTCLRGSRRNAFLFTTVLFLLLPPLLREHLFAAHDPATVRLITFARLDGIFYGVAMAFVTARVHLAPAVRTALFAVGSAGLIALAVFQIRCGPWETSVPFFRVAFVALPLCFGLLMPLLAEVETLPARLSFLAVPITKLSLWSYSIYLSHIPILFLTYEAFGGTRDRAAINVLSKLTALALCLAVSAAVYRWFESPLMRRRPAERLPA